MGERQPLIEVKHLVKHFPVRRGLSAARAHSRSGPWMTSASTSRSGETVGLVGESGCGKTTTGRMVMRLITPTAGDVCFEGRSINALSREEEKLYRRKVQMVFQDPSRRSFPE